MPPDNEDVVEDRGDEFVPPELEIEDPEDEEIEDIDPEDDDEESEGEEEEEDDEDSEDDSEDDEEDEDEESDEEDDEDEGDSDEGPEQIPKPRFDQVLSQRDEERAHRKWLEQQLEALIKSQAQPEPVEEEEDEGPPDFDFDAAEEKYAELLLEGDPKAAAQLRRAINDASREVYAYQIETAKKAAKNEAVSETTNSLDEVRFTALISDYTDQYDFLNDQKEGYNEKAVTMANKLMASYVMEGKSKSEALTAAVNDVVPLFDREKPPVSKKEKTDARKRVARKKAAKASQQQPPAVKGAKGKASRKWTASDVLNMSEKEFDGLSAREKAKLRGDIA